MGQPLSSPQSSQLQSSALIGFTPSATGLIWDSRASKALVLGMRSGKARPRRLCSRMKRYVGSGRATIRPRFTMKACCTER